MLTTPEVELAENNVSLLRGYALVASKLKAIRTKTSTIYRRFDELSARKLLFYQAKLAELEYEPKQLNNEDRKAKDKISVGCQRSWKTFEKHAYGRDGVAEEARDKKGRPRDEDSESIREVSYARSFPELWNDFNTYIRHRRSASSAPTPSQLSSIQEYTYSSAQLVLRQHSRQGRRRSSSLGCIRRDSLEEDRA